MATVIQVEDVVTLQVAFKSSIFNAKKINNEKVKKKNGFINKIFATN